jgi:hypothetical protein
VAGYLRSGVWLNCQRFSTNETDEIPSSGDIFVITDNLSSHNNLEARTWLEEHPRIHQVFISTGRAGSTSKRAGGASSAAMPSR